MPQLTNGWKSKLMDLLTAYKNRAVCVTGGAGFIGSHLVHTLVTLGAHVTVLDNLSSGNRDNLAAVESQIRFIQGSVTDYEACLTATKGLDTVFHLAAMVSVVESTKNPLLCHMINVSGTANILNACKANKVQRFVLSSSSAVYGPIDGIASEHMPCAPISPYGYSKWLGELLCQKYASLHGIRTVCLRYFNVYGERQNPNGSYAAAMAKFSHALAHSEPIVIYGDGQQTRDFVPVEEIVKANLMLAQLPPEQMQGSTFNIGSGKSISLLQLIEQLRPKFPSSQSSIQFLPARAGDIKHSAANCEKYLQAKSLLQHQA
jgi:nucleoside-diphosphate-sugar epimerase